MNPGYSHADKELWKVQLIQWSGNDLCPLEDADARSTLNQGPGAIQNQAGKSLVIYADLLLKPELFPWCLKFITFINITAKMF